MYDGRLATLSTFFSSSLSILVEQVSCYVFCFLATIFMLCEASYSICIFATQTCCETSRSLSLSYSFLVLCFFCVCVLFVVSIDIESSSIKKPVHVAIGIECEMYECAKLSRLV